MGKGIKDKVAILGMGCARFGERWNDDADALMVEAYREALADAGIETGQGQVVAGDVVVGRQRHRARPQRDRVAPEGRLRLRRLRVDHGGHADGQEGAATQGVRRQRQR